MYASLNIQDYDFQQKIKKSIALKGYDRRPQILDWARELNPQEKRVLETLLDFVQVKEGWHGIFPSIKTLAWRSQMSVRNLYRVKNSLQSKGFIDWVTLRDPKTRQLKCHFSLTEKLLTLSHREKGERYALPRLVPSFFDPKKGGDRLSQPVVTECHTYIRTKHVPSEHIQNKILRLGMNPPLGEEGELTTQGRRGGDLEEKNLCLVKTEETEKFRPSVFLCGEGSHGEGIAPDAERHFRSKRFSRIELTVGDVRARVQVPVEQVAQTIAAFASARLADSFKQARVGGSEVPAPRTAQRSNKSGSHRVMKNQSHEGDVVSEMDDLPFSKKKQVRRESADDVDPKEKRKLQAAERAKKYREKQYERAKELKKEREANPDAPVKRNESKKQGELRKQVSQLFQFFLARCKELNIQPYSESLSGLEWHCGIEMLKHIGASDAELAIKYAVENWKALTEIDDRLSREPYFYNITAKHRYTYYLRKATVEAANATKNEVSKVKMNGLFGGMGFRVNKPDHS